MSLIKLALKQECKFRKKELIVKHHRQQLHKDVIKCRACSLFEDSGIKRPYPFQGPTPALMAVLIEEPTLEDIKLKQKPKQLLARNTKPGKQFAQLLSEIGLSRSDVWLDALLKCPTKNVLGQKIRTPDVKTCPEVFGKRWLNLSDAPVVVCLGERVWKYMKALGYYGKKSSFEKSLGLPVEHKGTTVISGPSLPQAMKNASKMAKVRLAFSVAGEAIQGALNDHCKKIFPGAEIVSAKTYEELVDEAMKVLSIGLKGLPPGKHRVKILSLMRDVVRHMRSAGVKNLDYAIRVYEDLEKGKVVIPKAGGLSD